MAWTLIRDFCPAGEVNSFAEGDNFSIVAAFDVILYSSMKASSWLLLWPRRFGFLTKHVHSAFIVQVHLVLV